MASIRRSLEENFTNLEESMGVRQIDQRPRLAPVPSPKDSGRRPARNFGQLAIDQVIPDPKQPREEFSEEGINRLAHSIREKGQLQPIRVRWSEDLGKWMIISGERRWRATKLAGMPTITCFFQDHELSTSEVLEQQLIENCLREDLQPLEEAKAFSVLMEWNGWNGKQLAESLRITPSRISRALAILKLPEDIQAQVETGQISARSAYELSKLDNVQAQRALAQQNAISPLTNEQTSKLVRQRRGKRSPPQRSTKQTFVVEDGWKVVVSANKKAGYPDIERALSQALEEVRHRIANGLQLF